MNITKFRRKKLIERLSAKGKMEIAEEKGISLRTVQHILAGTVKTDEHGVIESAINKALLEAKKQKEKEKALNNLIDQLD